MSEPNTNKNPLNSDFEKLKQELFEKNEEVATATTNFQMSEPKIRLIQMQLDTAKEEIVASNTTLNDTLNALKSENEALKADKVRLQNEINNKAAVKRPLPSPTIPPEIKNNHIRESKETQDIQQPKAPIGNRKGAPRGGPAKNIDDSSNNQKQPPKDAREEIKSKNLNQDLQNQLKMGIKLNKTPNQEIKLKNNNVCDEIKNGVKLNEVDPATIIKVKRTVHPFLDEILAGKKLKDTSHHKILDANQKKELEKQQNIQKLADNEVLKKAEALKAAFFGVDEDHGEEWSDEG